jgi:hypothetical protein
MSTMYIQVVPDYIVGPFEPLIRRKSSPLSLYTVAKVGDLDRPDPHYEYLLHSAPYEMTSTISTVSSSWGLYATLAAQPMLLVFILLARNFLHSTPVSENFGLVMLLAGVQRDSLDILKGASFSGKLTNPVTVRVVVREELSSGTVGPTVEYILSDKSRASSSTS